MRTFKCLWISLLLCLLILPSASLADQHVRMKMEVSQEGLAEYMTARSFSQEDLDSFLEQLPELAKSLELDLTVSKGMVSLGIRSEAADFGTLSVISRNGKTYLTVSQMPMLAFLLPDAGKLTEMWEAVIEDVDRRLTSAGTEPGRYWGNAYTDGTGRETVTLSQQDLVNVLRMLTESKLYKSLLAGFEKETAAWLTEEEKAAEENRYSLNIARVSGADGIVGYSFTLLDQEEVVATLSVSPGKGEWHAVLGLGLENGIWYTDFRFHLEKEADGAFHLLSGLDFMQDTAGIGYEAIRGVTTPAKSLVFSMRAAADLNLMKSGYDLYLEENGELVLMQNTEAVKIDGKPCYAADFRLSEKKDPFLRLFGEIEETKAASIDVDSLIVIPLTEIQSFIFSLQDALKPITETVDTVKDEFTNLLPAGIFDK